MPFFLFPRDGPWEDTNDDRNYFGSTSTQAKQCKYKCSIHNVSYFSLSSLKNISTSPVLIMFFVCVHLMTISEVCDSVSFFFGQ